MTNYVTRPGGKAISNQLPLQVDDVSQANDRIAVAAETVTFNSAGAASSTGRNALDKAPIMNLVGDKVGSFWGEAKNKVMEFTNTGKFGTLTETATLASIVITDLVNNLEILFETTTGSRRYILRAEDAQGDVLYGWIGNVTVSGNDYTIPVHNAITSGAQSWIGTLANFETVQRVGIYAYESSFVWGTGTVLTEEVGFDEEAVFEAAGLKRYFDSLSTGQYGLNYRTGAIYFKKATTGTSDTATYNSTASASVSISSSGGSATKVDDAAFTVATDDVTPIGMLADDAATDSVDEGDVGVPRMSLDRRALSDANLQIANADVSNTNGVHTTTEDVSNGNSTALVASLVIKASAGKAFEIRGVNTGAAQFIQIHDAASLPADTAIPEDVLYVGANQNFSIVYERGKSFATGIVVCNSSTSATKTIGATNCWFSAEYE